MNKEVSWLESKKSEAAVLAEAYRLRLIGRLWWANLAFVVLPSVLATLAAILAAAQDMVIAILPYDPPAPAVASFFAGTAAVLTAVHKSLKCDEYQAECTRLLQTYKSIEEQATAALAKPTIDPQSTKQITDTLAQLNPKAPLPNKYILQAQLRTGHYLYNYQH